MAGYIGSKVAVVSSGAERKKVFTATSGQTSFTGLSYTVNNVHVFQNGVRLVDGTDYTATNGNSITLTVGAATDDQVVVVSYNTFQTSDTVSASTGGTFAGDVNFTGAFTSQGIDDNSTSTALTLDASGALLVGTTDDDPVVNNVDGVVVKSGRLDASNNGIAARFNRQASDGDIMQFRKDGSTVGSIGTYSGHLDVVGDTRGTRITDTAIIPISNAGAVQDNLLDLGYSGSRFKDLYLSGGVVFGSTSGSVTSKTLDDYEEGTWTPTYTSAGSNAITVTYDIRVGRYVKVGNMVKATFRIRTDAVSGGTSDTLRLTGLPFSSANVSSMHYGAAIGRRNGWGTKPATAYVQTNATYLLMIRDGSEGSGTLVRTDDLATGTNDNELDITVVYQTA